LETDLAKAQEQLSQERSRLSHLEEENERLSSLLDSQKNQLEEKSRELKRLSQNENLSIFFSSWHAMSKHESGRKNFSII